MAEPMERLRPLAEHPLLAVYRQTLSDEVDATLTDITGKPSRGKR